MCQVLCLTKALAGVPRIGHLVKTGEEKLLSYSLRYSITHSLLHSGNTEETVQDSDWMSDWNNRKPGEPSPGCEVLLKKKKNPNYSSHTTLLYSVRPGTIR